MWSQLPDFDTLLAIAQQDPDAYERFRHQQVEAAIRSSTHTAQARLRGLQFQIDSQRKLHPCPLGACIKISQMMSDSFACLSAQLDLITKPSPPPFDSNLDEDQHGDELELPFRLFPSKNQGAEIIPFRRN